MFSVVRKLRFLVGPLLGGLALTLYVVTLSRGASPGESASLIAQNCGLFPRLAPSHPLWHTLARAVGELPYGTLADRLNLLSALCGAGAVWLLYEVMRSTIFGLFDVYIVEEKTAWAASILAGTVSACALAISIPFWTVSNRAHTASFDILLLLLAIGLLLLYSKTEKKRYAILFAFVYSLGVVEFATFIVLAPFIGLALLWLLARNAALRPWVFLSLLASTALGLGLYFAAALPFMREPGYEMLNYTGYLQVVWFSLRSQYFLIAKSLPQEGWLIILLATAAPFAAGVWVARRALNQERDWGFYILHVVITAISLMVLFNTRLAPCRVAMPWGRLLVTPNLLASCVMGYAAAYWFLLLLSVWPPREPVATGAVALRLFPIAAACIAMLGFSGFANKSHCLTPGSMVANRAAEEMVDSLSGRTWLLCDTGNDLLLLIAAREKGVRLNVLNLRRAGPDNQYAKYVETMFDSPRLKNLAGVGLPSLIEEWMNTDPEIAGKLALMTLPDLWTAANYRAVPNKLLFLGAKESDLPAAEDLMALHRDFWNGTRDFLRTVRLETADNTPEIASDFVRQCGFVANNLGVMMEDMGLTNNASIAYQSALAMDPDNVSAMLNMANMIGWGYGTNMLDFVRRRVAEVARNPKSRRHLWSLSRYHGYVRSPAMFARLGWSWAQSGDINLAISGLSKALELAPAADKDRVEGLLADTYARGGSDEKSEPIYRGILERQPDHRGALLALVRISAKRGDLSEAQNLLLQAQKAGLSKAVVAFEMAALHLLAGRNAEARTILQDLLQLKPDYLEAWVLLAGILAQEGDADALNECFKSMERLNGGDGYICAVKCRIAMSRNEWDEARRYIDRALSSMGDNLQIMEAALRLDLIQKRYDLASLHARNILRRAPDHSFANYALGNVHLYNEDYKLAEDSLRRSLESDDSPKVLNNLAWAIQAQGRFSEAEAFARSAIEKNPSLPMPRDTLGVILMKTDRPDEAMEHLELAVAHAHAPAAAKLHLASLLAGRDNSRAVELAKSAADGKDDLSASDRKQLDVLKQELGMK